MLTFDNHVSFAVGEIPPVALRGFWGTEDGFVWSRGKWCDVTFDFQFDGAPTPGFAELMLDIDVFKAPEQLTGQNVMIYLNGLRIGSNFIERRLTSICEFDPKILRATDNILTLDTPDAAVPKMFGSGDTRQLGVQLFSVQVRKG